MEEEIKLSDEEVQFALVVHQKLSQQLVPTPWFVWSVSLLHYKNEQRLGFFIQEMMKNKVSLNDVTLSPEKLEYILTNAAWFEVWKRGLLMRLQWLLQLGTIYFIWRFIWVL